MINKIFVGLCIVGIGMNKDSLMDINLTDIRNLYFSEIK
jgi:hypothetical protein